MKICNIIGVRPHFIKYYAIQKALEIVQSQNPGTIEDILIHTGQHHDYDMDRTHFEGLKLRKPDYHLQSYNNIQDMTDKLILVLKIEKPNVVIIYGDTDTTLAGMLAAEYCKIPIAHVEAGARSYIDSPEERNRVLVDQKSTWRVCS